MAVEGAGEECRLPGRGREEVHQLGLAAERRDGPAVRHRLAERRQVGRHAGDRLVAAEPVAEARDHLVEDQDGAVLRRELAEPLEEPGLREDRADVVRDRLEDDRGDVAAARRARATASASLNGQTIVAVDDLRQHPARERILRADAIGGRDHVHRDGVVPAVVAALELDHVAAARRRRARRGGHGTSPRCPCTVSRTFSSDGTLRDEALGELDLDPGHADAHQVERAPRAATAASTSGSLWPRSGGPNAAW